MTSPKQADELLQRINRHIGQLSPHIKERETAQLLIAAYEALRVGELPNDLPSRFHAVWNDGFRDYTKEQLAWVFFQKGAMLAQPPSAPPEAGKVREALQKVRDIFFEDAGEDDRHPWISGAYAPRALSIIDEALRHPSPVAQGAGELLQEAQDVLVANELGSHSLHTRIDDFVECHPSHPTGSDGHLRKAWVYAYTSLGADEATADRMVDAEVNGYRNTIAPPKPTAPKGGK
jgi:hypothetical protein